MIHVLNYSENIIDDLSFKQDAIYDANHTINIQETMETFDFEVSSKIAQNLRDRHRLLIQDHMGIYREFIIENIVDLESGVTEVQSNASYLEDIRTAKPVKPHSFKDKPPTVMMDYLLADTGWEVSPETEVPMNADFSWDKVTDRLELLKELQDVFNMRLLFYVEVGKNNVEKRYVKLVEVNPIFNGEEIDYKENLIGLKREIDYSEVVTALLGVGPEDSETKKRIYVEVTDDKAQEQFGLPQRYIWDYYEVQVDSETEVNAGLIREETINELERRKKAVVTYDISSTDIDAQVGDMIRVKDEDFNPEIYLEAEIVEIHYNLLNNVKEYKFGILKEFTREQVYSQYDKFRKELEERLKEIISNTDSIISERLEEELKYVERHIEKSPTPPLAPKEGDLWLDTTDPKVAILKRYENGKWVKSSVDHVSQIGGLTREETMYDTLKERLYRIENSYFEAFKRHDALVTERHYHYVKDAIKNNLNIKLNGLKNSYDDFKAAFNNINSEQPTIGLITTAISRAVEFEAKLKEYNDSYYVARKEFDEVIAILQSQYSDEKFNEAMTEVAEAIGGTFDGTKIIADVPLKKDLDDLNNEIKKYLSGEIETLDTELGKKIENILINTKEEIRLGIESVEKKVDGIEIGGRNLLPLRDFGVWGSGYKRDGYKFTVTGKNAGLKLPNTHINSSGVQMTLSFKVKKISGSVTHLGGHTGPMQSNIRTYMDGEYISDSFNFNYINDTDEHHFVTTFTTGSRTDDWIYIQPNRGHYSLDYVMEIWDIKLEKGNKPTDWTPAPEDVTNYTNSKVDNLQIGGRNLLLNSEELILLKRTNQEVERLPNYMGVTNPIRMTNGMNATYFEPIERYSEDYVEGQEYTWSFLINYKGAKGVQPQIYVGDGTGYRDMIGTPLENNWVKITHTFKAIGSRKSNRVHLNLAGYEEIYLAKFKLEKGSKATDYSPAPEDIENKVSNISQTVTKNSASIGVLENQISLKADSTTVTQQLTNALKPIKTDVQQNAAELLVQKGLIEQRVTKTDYTTDMNGVVKRLSTSEGKISTLEKEIKLKVTETDVQNKIDELEIGGRNLISSNPKNWLSAPKLEIVSDRQFIVSNPNNSTWGRIGSPTYVVEKGQQIIGSVDIVDFNGRISFQIRNIDDNLAPASVWLNESDIGTRKSISWKNNSDKDTRVRLWLTVYGDSAGNEGQQFIEAKDVKLEKGNKATDWTPAPEDMEDRVKKAEGSITVNSDAIKQKVSYTEINKTNKTLERVISELIVDARGISYQYDVNGMIQGFTLNKDYFKLNHNLIDINNGDVVIQNGKTTIKDAFINNLAGNTAFINSLTGKTAFINKIKAIDINAENIRVGFNKIAGSLQVTSTGLEMYNGKTKTMQLDDRGSTFWSGTRLIGRIGSSYLTNDSSVKTLRFALDDPNSMMSWEYKENSSDKNYQMMLQYSPKVQKGHDKRGFIFNDDVSMVPSRALQLSYIRPLNYTGTGNRIYLSTWTWRGTRGVSMVGGNENGSGVWFGNNVVALYANTSGKAGQGDLDIASDSRSYFIRSETIYERDYGYSANVYITSHGTLGRATSARKYKAFIELQHETEEKQLEHSKKILQLKPKTWYSKSLLETVAKEIETGEVDSADDFKIERQFGMIADEFEEVGLTELVQYGKNDEVEGLAYDRMSVHHNVLIKDLYDENDALKDRINDLENKLNKIMEMIE